jgi:NAD(P)-dependent dehydrogenase (short-subunit alcohol dehydrogenase family)
VAVDLATPDGPGELAQAALDAAGRIDIVVNNVGGLAEPRTGGFLSLTDDQWRENFDLNFYSAIRLSRATLPHLVEQRGAMVNISSVGALTPGPFHIDYAASKAALNALTKALSIEFGPKGVRVNLVSVGTILTEGWMDEGRFGDQLAAQMGISKEEAMELMVTQLGELSLARWGQVDEVVRAVLFFVSDAGSYCSGADLRVDGGLYKGL